VLYFIFLFTVYLFIAFYAEGWLTVSMVQHVQDLNM